MADFDAIIIGAGHNGLTAALLLQRAGLRTLCLEAKRYAGRIEKGGILLSVHSDNSDWTKRAKEILKETGAEDISATGEASADFDETKKPRARVNV